jgi:O-antigen ligase
VSNLAALACPVDQAHTPASAHFALPGYRAAALAVFVTAGDFKAEPWLAWLPVDFTLLAAVFVVLLVCLEVVRSLHIPAALLPVAVLFGTFLPCLLWTKWTPFANEILRGFFALTLLACAAPTFLLRSRRDVYEFLSALCLLGVFVALNALYWFVTDPSRFERIGAETPISTIVVGQMVGLATVWLTLLAVNRRLNLLLALGTLALLTSVLIGVGSRGPLLMVVVPIALVVLFNGRSRSAAARCVAIALVAALGIQIGLGVAPESATSRVESFLLGEPDTSTEVRIEYAALAADAIQVNPLGLGLAGFSSKIVPWVTGPRPYAREYPHNVFLEAFVDGGWLAGLTLLLIVTAALVRCLRLALHSRPGVEYTGLLAILIYQALEGTVSGTISESRMFFALLGTALGLSSSDSHA